MKHTDVLNNSLFTFCQLLGYTDISNIHYKMCRILESDSKRKLIVVPRGYFKTSITSIAYPLWLVCKNPNIRILLVAKSANNASKRVRLIRRFIETNSLLQKLYPHILPVDTHKIKWNDQCTTINRSKEFLEGTFESAGTGTSLPSRHYDVIIEDDIVAAEKDDMTQDSILPNPAEIAKAVGFHKMLPTLLAPPINNSIVIHVATRWDNQDVVQYILDNEADEYQTLVTGVLDEKGEPTFPEFYPREVIDKLLNALGSSMFALQYENRPLAESDYMIKQDQIVRFEIAPLDILNLAIIVDPAISAKKSASNAVVLVVGVDSKNRLYIIDYICSKGMTPKRICNAIIRLHKQYSDNGSRLVKVGIETVGYQQSLCFYLKEKLEEEKYWFNITELIPRADKHSRIMRLQPFAEDGRLLVRLGLDEFVKQALDFPASRAATYDLLDAAAYVPEMLITPKPIIRNTKQDGILFDDMLKSIRNRGRLGRDLPFENQNYLFKI
ncbi:MAG: hypothetical protein ACOYWZ_15030 [Bacillota bacterium]